MTQITNKPNHFSIFSTLPLELIYRYYVRAWTKHHMSASFAIVLMRNCVSLIFITHNIEHKLYSYKYFPFTISVYQIQKIK